MLFGRVIIYCLLCYVYEITAIHDTQLFKKVDCFVGHTVLASLEAVSSGHCAFHCIEQRGAGFSYDARTRECKLFKAILKDDTSCGMSSNIYGNVDKCETVPFLRDHRGVFTFKRPFLGDNSLTRYRCTNFEDSESVESCPVSRCGEVWNPASLSCAEKDVFNSSRPYEGKVTCTVKGVTCQHWDRYNNGSDTHNRCMVFKDSRPFCYTTDKYWDYCPVEERIICDEPPSMNLPDISIAIEWPYYDAMSVARYRCVTSVDIELVSSCPVAKCRSDGSWSSASVSCSDKECYNSTNKVYDGRVTCTWTGIPCQRWDSDYPHAEAPNYNHGQSDLGNRCLMADENRPWCFTTDPLVQWDWCPVDECLNINRT